MSNDSVAEWLTEEWTIRPESPLPSSWEIAGINALNATVTDTLQVALKALFRHGHVTSIVIQRYLHRRRTVSTPEEGNPVASTVSSSAEGTSRAFDQHHPRLESASRSQIRGQWQKRGIRLAFALIAQYWSRYGLVFCTAVMRYAIERYCLRISSPCSYSLAESMYSLGRVKRSEADGSFAPLQDKDQSRLALWMALGPLIHELCKTYTEHTPYHRNVRQSDAPPMQLSNGRYNVVRNAIRNIHRTLLIAMEGGNLYCQWRYLLGTFPYTDMRNLLLKQVVVRRHHAVSPQVSAKLSAPEWTPPTNDAVPSQPQPADTLANASAMPKQSSRILIAVLGAAATFSWVTQLLRWYQDRIRERHQQRLRPSNEHLSEPDRVGNVAGIVPPPLLCNTDDCKAALKLPKGTCPICSRRQPRNPVVCAPSGFVFCQLCILRHVRQHGTCPVTRAIVSESKLVRVFEPVDVPTTTGNFEGSKV